MKDFLRDAKWFVFSVLVIAGLWFGAQVSDYFEGLERERLQEERRLANEKKKREDIIKEREAAKKTAERKAQREEDEYVSFFETDEYLALQKKEFFTGLVCDGHERYYPIRIILESIEGLDDPTGLKYIKPILDEITRTISYEIVDIRFEVFPKKINFYGEHLYKESPPDSIYKKRNYSNEVFSLNRESLELVISYYDDRYILQCSKVDASIIEEYVSNNNESIAKSNVL